MLSQRPRNTKGVEPEADCGLVSGIVSCEHVTKVKQMMGVPCQYNEETVLYVELFEMFCLKQEVRRPENSINHLKLAVETWNARFFRFHEDFMHPVSLFFLFGDFL